MINQADNPLFFEEDSIEQTDKPLFDDEELFSSDDISTAHEETVWEVLIIDDEEDVHQLTRFVLDDYLYQGKKLEFISAYSSQEAKQLLQQHLNIAVILLDVVMETNDAGLKLVEYIREQQQNHFVRIILRTGQPGYAPEKQVIHRYDINDYQNKTELTDQKLFTVITASLRAYSDMMTIESYRQHLEEKVQERTRELQEKNETLVKLNQEKNEFLGIAAHDLKNPLSAIQTLASIIINSFGDYSKEQVIEFVKVIENSSHKMFELIKNLLDVNAIESGKINISLRRLNLRHPIQAITNNYLRAAKEKTITLHFQLMDEHQEFNTLVDENAILQVLDNLISNAVKYSPHHKNVYIRMTHHENKVRCEIQDEGPGLNEKDRDKLFGKFVRLTPRPTGDEHSTGLGLFIVKKLVESMQGQVWCETQLGQGATFILEFPQAPE